MNREPYHQTPYERPLDDSDLIANFDEQFFERFEPFDPEYEPQLWDKTDLGFPDTSRCFAIPGDWLDCEDGHLDTVPPADSAADIFSQVNTGYDALNNNLVEAFLKTQTHIPEGLLAYGSELPSFAPQDPLSRMSISHSVADSADEKSSHFSQGPSLPQTRASSVPDAALFFEKPTLTFHTVIRETQEKLDEMEAFFNEVDNMYYPDTLVDTQTVNDGLLTVPGANCHSQSASTLGLSANASPAIEPVMPSPARLPMDHVPVYPKSEIRRNGHQMHRCPVCHKTFKRPLSFKIHYSIHTGYKHYRCEWPGCGKSFNVKSNMTRHRKMHMRGR